MERHLRIEEFAERFGAKVVGKVTWEERERKMITRDVALVRHRVKGCAACGLRETCSAPVPMTQGTSRSELVIIGEAPGEIEDGKGVPFVGPSGRLVRSMLPENGEPYTWLNVVSCRPPENRAPKKTEIAACKANLRAQLQAVRARYLLLLGGTALNVFRPDLKVMYNRGYVFTPGGEYVAMATFHPSAVLRDKGLRHLFRRDLAKFIATTLDGYKIELHCILCGHNAVQWDVDGIGWCWEHGRKWGEKWVDGWSGDGRTRKEKAQIKKRQTTLFG